MSNGLIGALAFSVGALALLIIGIVVCFEQSFWWGMAAVLASIMLVGALLMALAE